MGRRAAVVWSMAFGVGLLLAGSAPAHAQPATKPQPAEPKQPDSVAAPPAGEPTTTPPPDAKRPLPVMPQWRADSSRPFLEYADAWPARVMVKGKLGVIKDVEGEILGWNQRFGFFGPLEVDDEDREDLKVWRDAYGSDADARFEGKGCYLVSFSNPEGKRFSQRTKPTDRPVMRFKYISAERDPVIAKPGNPADGTPIEQANEKPRVTIQRASFVLYEPYSDADKLAGTLPAEKSRGIALVMPGLFGTPDTVVDVMVRRLRQDRWYVLRLLAAPSRFTETTTYTFDTSKETETRAREMGVVLGNRAAEIAYAVQAAFVHVAEARPELATLPRVAIGSSAGAITLPTVVAREPEKYSAAVMIGGGADFWLINWRSNYRRGVDAIRLRWVRGDPTEADERKIDDAYLASAALDSFHTAKALRTKPVLMVHGAVDRAVPAVLGDLLWERLDRPERRILQVGHELLFANVAGQLTEITAWLSQAVEGKVPPRGNAADKAADAPANDAAGGRR